MQRQWGDSANPRLLYPREGINAMTYMKPLPQVGPDTRTFWEGCREHVIRIQKCDDCGYLRWPPAFLCPRCLSQNAKWIKVSGRGTVYSYIVYHVAYDAAFQGDSTLRRCLGRT